MSKSRGTFITAGSYLKLGLNPEWLRYYYREARPHIGRGPQPRRLRGAGEQRSGRQIREHREPHRRLHSQAFRWLAQRFAGRPCLGRRPRRYRTARTGQRARRGAGGTRSQFDERTGPALLAVISSNAAPIGALYEAREYGKALRRIMALADLCNRYVDRLAPWDWPRISDATPPRSTSAARLRSTHSGCSRSTLNRFFPTSRATSSSS